MPRDTWNSGEQVLTGVRFDIYALELDKRSGGSKRREVVVPADAVVIVPMLDEQTVVLIRNERFAVEQTLWELPAGTLEAGEEPRACAERELTEETGYAAEGIMPLCDFYTSPGFCTERIFAYAARGLRFVGQDLDDTERITAEATAVGKAMEMIRGREIRDGKTIAAFLYYMSFGRNGD